ncbi:catalase family protein [Gordonia sp. CPCC 206044]|uniref:catalase family protein n=1 Tax=Gordonia sp. CPCC 206044 TaxID=3140793 RepID=UPI003AF39EB1
MTDTDPVTTSTDPNRTYVEYHDDIETPEPREAEDIETMVRVLRLNNERAYRKYKHGIRDAHAKGHGLLRGELEVAADLPPEFAQGMFAESKTYPIVARYSSTSGAIRNDGVRGVRGLGVKVIGVDGDRLQDDDATTQDFIMVTHREFLFKGARDYATKGMVFAFWLARLPDPLLKVGSKLLAALDQEVLARLPGRCSLPESLMVFVKPNTHILGDWFHTSAPLRYGRHVAKMQIVPSSPEVKALSGHLIGDDPGVNALRDSIVDFYALHSAEYALQVQLCTDLATMPIEDATAEWKESESPYVTVATIRFPSQDPATPERVAFADDVLSFNSWRGLQAHRPLGSINRLKRRVYDASSDFRHQANNAPRIEPSDVGELPR